MIISLPLEKAEITMNCSRYPASMKSDGPAAFSSLDNYTSCLQCDPDGHIRNAEYQCKSADDIVAFSGFSEVQMKPMYKGTKSEQTDASFGVSNHAGISCYCPYKSTKNGTLDTSVELSHWMPKEETISTETYTNMGWQEAESDAFSIQAVKEPHDIHAIMKDQAAASDVAPRSVPRKSNPKAKASEAEQRRSIVAQRMQALQELLPASSKVKPGDQESILDNSIAHVKYLQLQLKELSRSRLQGESLSPLNFLEGYGHYHPDEQMSKEPLEDILGRLMEENLAAASKLLESKGLCMIPISFTDSLHNAQ